MKSLFFSTIVLLACVGLGLGLKCYFGGKDDTEESDLQETIEIESQNGGDQQHAGPALLTCFKNTTTLGDTVTVERGGLFTKEGTGCDTTGHVEYCKCNTDACNTAPHTSAILLLPLLILPGLITQFV